MTDLFEIYKFAFLLAPLAAIALSLLGAHLVSRNESLQLMALAQAALVGSILGHILQESQGIFNLFSSLVLFTLVKIGFSYFKVTREQIYIVIYLIFISLSYLLITLFPNLDAHFTVGFFGDIVSLSVTRSIVLSSVFTLILAGFIVFHKQLIKSTFSKSILNSKKLNLLEEVFLGAGVLISLYGLGFLFTLTFLLCPVLIAGKIFKNIRQEFIITALVAGVAAVLGLGLSIVSERVATVPAQTLMLVLLMFITRLVLAMARRMNGKSL